MDNELNLIEKAFRKYAETRQLKESITGVVRLLASGCDRRQEITGAIGQDYAFVREDLLDLLLYFVDYCISDHSLSNEQKVAILTLKRLFNIKEGHLYGLRRRKIQELMHRELRRILIDRTVDQAEALYLGDLQDVFDLSYDQQLELTRGPIEEVVTEAITTISEQDITPAKKRKLLNDRIRALDTVYFLTDRQVRSVLGPSPEGAQAAPQPQKQAGGGQLVDLEQVHVRGANDLAEPGVG